MEEEPNIETLQAEVMAMKDEHEKMKAELQASMDANKKMSEDLQRARDLNAQLIARAGSPSDPETPKDPLEGLTPSEALEQLLPELVDREAAKMVKTKE